MFYCKPVTVAKGAFAFCKWSLVAGLWAAWWWRIPELAALCAAILLLSAVLTVRRAPLVSLYTWAVERRRPSAPVVLDENGMRFAHIIGALAVGVGTALTYLAGWERVGWSVLFWTALGKTAGALGYCALSKVWGLLAGGRCCGPIEGNTCGRP